MVKSVRRRFGRGLRPCTYGIRLWELESQAVGLALVYRVVVQDAYIEVPFSEAVAVDELNAGRQAMLVDLRVG